MNLASDTDSTDPALASHVVSAQYLFATAAKLVNYPDLPAPEGLELVPEVAADLPDVSADGRTYTFRVRTGEDAYHLSNGEVVTAEHFAEAVNRALAPELQSPAASFIRDIAGAEDVLSGRTASAEGVRVLAPDRLQIELEDVAPDFLHRVAMPYFGAIPLGSPCDAAGVDALPSAGPYAIVEWVRGSRLVLRRNLYYRHSRPRYVDEIVYTIGVKPDESVEQIEAGRADLVADGLPPEMEGVLGAKYGVNRIQFMVTPSLQLDYMALNCSRPLFSDPRVRRAVNFAIDRPAGLAARGEYAGSTTDCVIPPGMPGHRDEPMYPLNGPDFERARTELPENFAEGHAVLYTWDTLAGSAIGEIVRANLKHIGIDVEVIAFPETEMHRRASRSDEPFDAVLSGCTADYPDPYVFINALLDGTTIRQANNANDCYFDDPRFNAQMRQAARLAGEQRADAYRDLERDLMAEAAPMVPWDNRTKRDFVSARVAGAHVHPIYGLNLGAMGVNSEPTR